MNQWCSVSSVNLVKSLGSDVDFGLNDSVAEKHREIYGKNVLVTPKMKSFTSVIFSEVKEVWSLLSILCIILLLSIGNYIPLAFILVAYITNLFIYISLEYKDEKKLKDIEKFNSSHVNVIRDGDTMSVTAEELVVGDIVYIEKDRYVPADIRLIQCEGLKVNELAVTGENYEIEKFSAKIEEEVSSLSEVKNMVFKSTVVKEGTGIGVVVAVGMETQIGNIVKILLHHKKEKNNLLKSIKFIMNRFAIISFLPAIFIVGISLALKFDKVYLVNSFVSIILAFLPIQSVLAMIFCIWIYVKKLSRKNIYFNNISAIEVLSNTNLIFSDTIGIFSKNEMIVSKIYADECIFKVASGEELVLLENLNNNTNKANDTNTSNNTKKESIRDLTTHSTLDRLIQILLLSNDSSYSKEKNEEKGDATEIGIIKFALNHFYYKNEIQMQFQRALEIPYDSEKRIKTTINKVDNKYRANVQGAIDSLLSRCTHVLKNGVEVEITKEYVDGIKDVVLKMSKNSLKVVGAAYRNFNYEPSLDENIESNLVFVGLVGLINPLKIEAFESIKLCRLNGIRPILCMQDNKITSKAIAKDLGVLRKDAKVFSGVELEFMEEQEFKKAVQQSEVYAALSSKHKVKVVEELKNKDFAIASLGFKLTDLPFMNISNVSIAFSNKCSNMIKKLSDIFVEEMDILKVINLIKESRQILNSLLNIIQYMIFSVVSTGIFILLSSISSHNPSIAVKDVIWLYSINAVISTILLFSRFPNARDGYEGVKYSEKDFFKENITLNKYMMMGIIIGIISYIGFAYGNFFKGNEFLGHTISLGVLSLAQSLGVLNFTEKGFVFENIFSNILLLMNLLVSAFIISTGYKIPELSFIKLSMQQWIIVMVLTVFSYATITFFREKNEEIRF